MYIPIYMMMTDLTCASVSVTRRSKKCCQQPLMLTAKCTMRTLLSFFQKISASIT